MSLHEIVLPQTKPETEWVAGRPLQKVSPTRGHVRVQDAIWLRLNDWARDRGEAGTEWRFRIKPPGEIRRPLVPDVAYVSRVRTRDLSDDELEVPPISPDVAVEVLSPDDRYRDIVSKVSVYLRSGTQLVILLDPKLRTAELHDADRVTRLGTTDVLTHPALPEFALALAPFFEEALRRRDRID